MSARMQSASRRRYTHLNPAIALLLLAQLSLGMLRIQIVPLGFNVDEIIHFANAKLVAAACLRDTVGLSWSLHRNDSQIRNNPPWGEDVTAWIAFNEDELRKVNPNGPDRSPCNLLYDRRRLTNSAYYLWSGLPMAIFNNLSDRTTMNLGRIATLFLGLSTTVLGYMATRNFFPRRTALPIGVAILMALNQHMGDITTGINSDAGAIFSITLLFYTLSTTLSRKITVARGVSVLAAILLCLFVKSTAWIGIPIATMWLVIRLPTKIRRLSVIVIVLVSIILPTIFLQVRLDVPAHWFLQDTGGKIHFRPATVHQQNARIGRNALLVDSDYAARGIVQVLPETTVAALRGKTITVGAWIHAPSGTKLKFPYFATDSTEASLTTLGNDAWQFRAMVAEVPKKATYLSVSLPAPIGGTEPVLYDGVVLATGEYADNIPPSFTSYKARRGIWGELGVFNNLIRNASAESMWPRFEVRNIFGISTNRALWSILSWQRTARSWLRELPSWLFTMYWSGFGGTQPGLNRWQLLPFFAATLIAIIGMLRELLRVWLPWEAKARLNNAELRTAWLLIASMGLIWIMVVIRSDIFPHLPVMFTFAGTRYGLPAILPVSILFTLGWMQLPPAQVQRAAIAGITLLLFLVSVHILIRVQLPVYECPLTPANLCLSTIN